MTNGNYLVKEPASSRIFLISGTPFRSVLNLFAKLAGPPPEHDLSQREKETLEWLVQGLTTKEIADQLGLSIHTVDTHLRNIYRKLHVHSRTGAVAKVMQAKLH
jgi:DNA-binding CsgD family transcriptional regulator